MNPTVNWPPMAHDFNWVDVPKVSVYADQSDVLGDGNCLLYAFVEGFTHQFPNWSIHIYHHCSNGREILDLPSAY
jgi:hypothetical protein